MAFRIDLPVYRGPLDLLLYLVRRHELDLTEMPLASIVHQYVDYIEVLKELDLGDVGDFIGLASTLVELKSQAVLPRIEEESDEATIADPESELVERLLQYKEIRDAASVLEEMGHRWQQRYPRLADDLPSRRVDPGDQPLVDLEIWDLVSAFGRIMREAGGPPETEVIYDETPIHVYMQRIHDRLKESASIHLIDLVEGGTHKSTLIGLFLATLELTRHHGAAVEQDAYGEISIVRTMNYSQDIDFDVIEDEAQHSTDDGETGDGATDDDSADDDSADDDSADDDSADDDSADDDSADDAPTGSTAGGVDLDGPDESAGDAIG